MNISYLNTPSLIAELNSINLRKSPRFLGQFAYKQFSRTMPRELTTLRHVVSELKSLVPDQQFNTLFIQRYLPNQGVNTHRDPRNNIGHTVIGLFGSDWVTNFKVSNQNYTQYPGEAYVLPCTINNIQGPPHSMNWISGNGIRWAVILNTIE